MISSSAAEGFEAGLNSPFAGALVPMRFYQKNSRVGAIMVEVRRDLYLNENSGSLLDTAWDIRKRINRAISGVLSRM